MTSGKTLSGLVGSLPVGRALPVNAFITSGRRAQLRGASVESFTHFRSALVTSGCPRAFARGFCGHIWSFFAASGWFHACLHCGPLRSSAFGGSLSLPVGLLALPAEFTVAFGFFPVVASGLFSHFRWVLFSPPASLYNFRLCPCHFRSAQ